MYAFRELDVADNPAVIFCGICPHGCRLEEGRTGACHAWRNSDGRIVPLAYGTPCAVAVDPMDFDCGKSGLQC